MTMENTRAELESERNSAQLRLARAVRHDRTGEAREASRDFAYAKARIALHDLLADYPPMTRAQRATLKRMLST